MAYLDPKGKRDKSMPGNHGLRPGVWGGAVGDPRDMAKAGLLEAQSPGDGSSHPPERRLKPVPALRRVMNITVATFGAMERCPVRALKEMSGTPTSRCCVRQGRTWDRLRDASPIGDGGLIVVAGVTSGQGGRESRPQGKGGQVTGHVDAGRYA
jgi:hypothetical protein